MVDNRKEYKKCISFSVIIPAYNAEKFIVRAVESIRNQTYKEYEIIIIDDGSTDRTREIINQYINEHPDLKIKYIYQDNGGAAAARATGIENAKMKYVAFLDADDIWYSNKLEAVCRALNKIIATVVYSDEYETTLNGKKKLVQYRQLQGEALDDLIINGNALSTSTVVVERNALLAANTFKQGKRAGEDIQCWIELARQGASFYHISEALGEYIRTSNSLTLGSPEYVKNTNEMLLGFYDYLSREKYTEDEIERMKKKRKIVNFYNQGRCFHVIGRYSEAIKEYKKSLKVGGIRLKTLAVLMLAYLKINK